MKSTGSFDDNRLLNEREHYQARIILFIMGVLLVFLIFFIAWSFIIKRDAFYHPYAQSTWIKQKKNRGTLVDRNDNVMAVSINHYYLVVDPSILPDVAIDFLDRHYPNQDLKTKLVDYRIRKRRYFILEKNLTPFEREKSIQWLMQMQSNPGDRLLDSTNFKRAVRMLERIGIYFERRNDLRFYPAGSVGSSLIGLINHQNKGLFGLEKLYDERLQTDSFQDQVVRNAKGHVIHFVRSPLVNTIDNTNSLKLSIDNRLQSIAYRYVSEMVDSISAKRAVVLIGDVKTGEILANVDYPSFDPNHRNQVSIEYTNNVAFMNQVEPGSVIKPLMMMGYLQHNVYDPHEKIDISKKLRVKGYTVEDFLIKKRHLSLTEIISLSSNAGIGLLIQRLSRQQLIEFFHNLNFSYKTAIGFPGEDRGRLMDYFAPDAIWAASSFGYSIETTLMQLLSAYLTLARQGVYVPIRLEHQSNNEPVFEEKIFDPQNTQIVREMMFETVQNGTAKRAKVEGYNIAGKTGTARKIVDGRYSEEKHQTIFVGMTPVDSPDLVMLVFVDEPGKNYIYSSKTSAPLFAKIMKEALLVRGQFPSPIKAHVFKSANHEDQ